ncbi:MAG: hypothetical protein OEL87_02250 [Nanoarchaeota archaeon]|nr:hypothetical protein [Nanoarchaeota archaeon]
MKREVNKKAQVTIFIIIAIVVVGGVIAYFSLRGGFQQTIPEDLRPAYDYYISCLEATAEGGVHLLGEQGGHIEIPEFEPGSAYMPFSSQLNFLGQPVPYWMYASGNNLLREKVPTRQTMERELNDYVSERVGDCDFSDFEAQGYDVYVDEGSVVSNINDLSVDLTINNKITIFKNNQSVIVTNHDFSISSKLGKFYGMALDVYNYEKSSMFLEKYALDVMRLYAPVDGTEIGCAPKVFVDEEIRQDIVGGLASNIPSIKLDGNYYDLSSKDREYFVSDSNLDIDENINFMYLSDWPTTIEMYGDRVAKPVGLQPGMAVMGFCYVPYHFVYDINFPVLVQFYDDNEIFQFPVAVIIAKNQAREALPTTAGTSVESKVCEFKNQNVSVHTYDVDLNPIDARIQFKCLNSICEIGETKTYGEDSVLDGQLPQCVNGFIIASAEGYADSRYQISTNEEDIANIVLNKKYNLSLDLPNVKRAMISFSSDDFSTTVVYPEMKSVELIEGYYNISVYVYDNSSLKFPATSRSECVDIPETGLAGLFGAQTEKCYDINMPEMNIDFAVIGGGKNAEYITSEDLENSNKLNIDVPLFGLPQSLEELIQ